MTINELIQKAHAQAKEKGFWDQERNTGELLMLIVSECGEALEAHRKGRRAKVEVFEAQILPTMKKLHEGVIVEVPLFSTQVHVDSFKENIKDTFEDELADIVIRIADYAGSKNLDLGRLAPPAPRSMDLFEPKNIGELLLDCVRAVCRLSEKEFSQYDPIRYSIGIVFLIAALENIDLWRHIELKLQYNATRPRLHGKAY